MVNDILPCKWSEGFKACSLFSHRKQHGTPGPDGLVPPIFDFNYSNMSDEFVDLESVFL